VALREIWDRAAQAWGDFAASPDHDHLYWAFHRLRFLDLLPPPGRLTVDLGAGEGRLTAELARAGHRVVAIDSSPAMVSRAVQRADVGRALVGDASRLPLPDSVADLAVAFMSLQDMDDLATAVAEGARVLCPGGRFCLAVAHPVRSAGGFESKDPGSPFTIAGSYFERRPWPWRHSHSGMTISIPSEHRPLEAYSAALEDAGLLIESLREPAPDPEAVAGRPPLLRWTRLPCFLHIRALKPPR